MYPQPGRGGGWALLGGARTDLSGLNAAEVHALFVLAGPAASIDAKAKAALRKLVRAPPETFRPDAQAAATAVVVDPMRWGESRRPTGERAEQLEHAVIQRRKVRFMYAGARGAPAERVVDPWGLVEKHLAWHLVAGTVTGRRTFRVDRLSDLAVLDARADRPDDFDLATAWSGVVDEVERHRSGVTATLLVDPRHLAVVRDQWGRHFHHVGTADDGRARVEVDAPTPLMVAQPLAGWGALIDVEGPAEVRAELARLGRELADGYG